MGSRVWVGKGLGGVKQVWWQGQRCEWTQGRGPVYLPLNVAGHPVIITNPPALQVDSSEAPSRRNHKGWPYTQAQQSPLRSQHHRNIPLNS